jgi:hypothetical protein
VKFCKKCDKKLRVDNTIGMCRAHRNSSEDRKKYIKKYTLENPEKIKRVKKKHAPKKYKHYVQKRKTDPVFKLQTLLRTRLLKALKSNYKKGSAVEMLGCSIEEFKEYLESKFTKGMSWDNHGTNGWHIDHIIPLSRVDLQNISELKKVCHYTNMQPLWAVDNLKKSNRI